MWVGNCENCTRNENFIYFDKLHLNIMLSGYRVKYSKINPYAYKVSVILKNQRNWYWIALLKNKQIEEKKGFNRLKTSSIDCNQKIKYPAPLHYEIKRKDQ
jgi:transcriptional regulatory protein LevR